MMTMEDLMLNLEDKGLQLTMQDGKKAYFNYYWLRDNCPSSWDKDSQERSFDILKEPDNLKPKKAKNDGQALIITWKSGHQSRYSLDWLNRWSRDENGKIIGHGDIAVRTRRSWFGDHHQKLARFSYNDLINHPALVADWTEAMLDEGVALLTEMPDSDSALTNVCELIGNVRSSFFGSAFNVRSRQKPINLGYTSKALELHTDLPPEELPPGIQFLHCRINDVEGGYNLFVDATNAANALREQHPNYFKILTETDVPFRYTTDTQDIRARQRIIELDPDNGEVSGVTYSQHLADVFDLPQRVMDEFYPAFRKFGQLIQDSKYLMRFRINAGECIVFDNHRIAHGREAFVESSGARVLRGCYVDRGEMRSTYRVLRKKYPAPKKNK